MNLDSANEESRQQLREYEETKKQIEEDADREILDIKNKYERKLREEKEANLRLKSETGVMRRKVRCSVMKLFLHSSVIVPVPPPFFARGDGEFFGRPKARGLKIFA